MRQYFNVIVRARNVLTAIREDTAFLDTVRRGLLPLPSDHLPAAGARLRAACAGRPAAADGARPVSCPLAAAVGPAGHRAGQHLAGRGAAQIAAALGPRFLCRGSFTGICAAAAHGGIGARRRQSSSSVVLSRIFSVISAKALAWPAPRYWAAARRAALSTMHWQHVAATATWESRRSASRHGRR